MIMLILLGLADLISAFLVNRDATILAGKVLLFIAFLLMLKPLKLLDRKSLWFTLYGAYCVSIVMSMVIR